MQKYILDYGISSEVCISDDLDLNAIGYGKYNDYKICLKRVETDSNCLFEANKLMT